MLSITHVLCPVDLSSAAADALRYAEELRAALHAELSVLFVGSGGSNGRDERESSELAAFIDGAIGSAVELRRLHRQGQPIEEILRSGLTGRPLTRLVHDGGIEMIAIAGLSGGAEIQREPYRAQARRR